MLAYVQRAYLENDLTGVIDALEKILAEQLDRHEKYILAVVAIRGQSVDSFPAETKDRLISRLSYKGDENLLDYWIYLGRLEADQAIDAAMRMSLGLNIRVRIQEASRGGMLNGCEDLPKACNRPGQCDRPGAGPSGRACERNQDIAWNAWNCWEII
uniref:type VII secretion protein EssB/YukC n=1 Tax=Lacrimispora sp. TaxID=2719234 RepID=UPI0028A2B680